MCEEGKALSMNLLAVDTSGPVAGVAVMRDGQIAYEGAAVNRMTHSVNLMPMVEEALNKSGVDIAQIDLFAAVTGPGSFTGVRIGVSTVKGLAHGSGKPCIGINALEALAAGITGGDSLICPIQDARAGQVYAAAFEGGFPPVRRMEDEAAVLADFVKRAAELAKGRTLFFVGDGVAVHRHAIEAMPGVCAVFAPAHLCFLRPAAVAALACGRAEQARDYLSLQPYYLRAPQAERARASRMEAEGV